MSNQKFTSTHLNYVRTYVSDSENEYISLTDKARYRSIFNVNYEFLYFCFCKRKYRK